MYVCASLALLLLPPDRIPTREVPQGIGIFKLGRRCVRIALWWTVLDAWAPSRALLPKGRLVFIIVDAHLLFDTFEHPVS